MGSMTLDMDMDWLTPMEVGTFSCHGCDERGVVEDEVQDEANNVQEFTVSCACGTNHVSVYYDTNGGVMDVSLTGELYRE